MFGKKKSPEPSQTAVKAKKPIYKRIWFWLLVLCVLAAFSGGGGETAEDPVASGQESQVQSEASGEEVQGEPTELSEEEKAAVRTKDSTIWGGVLSVETKFNFLLENMSLVGTSVSVLDLYNQCEETKDFAQFWWGEVTAQQDDANEDYVTACQYYFVEIKGICDDMMDYLDSGKVSDLSNAQERIENISSHTLNIVSERQLYLTNAGFTPEEIEEINSAWDAE